jgi:hypothetical protein
VPAPNPAHYLRLSDVGGHPGNGPAQTSSRGIDHEHAVIIAFAVQESGGYSVGHSFISRTAGGKNGAVRLQVFVDDRNVGADIFCRSREPMPFDRELGRLPAGTTIYVVVGPDETDVNDGFNLDFSIERTN